MQVLLARCDENRATVGNKASFGLSAENGENQREKVADIREL